MSDFGAAVINGIVGGFFAAMPPGACDPSGRCWAWNNPPPRVVVVPAPQPYYPPLPPQQHPRPRPTAEEADLKGEILAFCDHHPEERFCGKLGAWLQQHPESQ